MPRLTSKIGYNTFYQLIDTLSINGCNSLTKIVYQNDRAKETSQTSLCIWKNKIIWSNQSKIRDNCKEMNDWKRINKPVLIGKGYTEFQA